LTETRPGSPFILPQSRGKNRGVDRRKWLALFCPLREDRWRRHWRLTGVVNKMSTTCPQIARPALPLWKYFSRHRLAPSHVKVQVIIHEFQKFSVSPVSRSFSMSRDIIILLYKLCWAPRGVCRMAKCD